MSHHAPRVSGTPNAASAVSRISSSAMLSEAADRMRRLDTARLSVVEHGEIIGMIMDRDIVQAVSAGWDPTTTPVKYAMISDAAPGPQGRS